MRRMNHSFVLSVAAHITARTTRPTHSIGDCVLLEPCVGREVATNNSSNNCAIQ